MTHPCAKRFWPPSLAEDPEGHRRAAECTVPQTRFAVRIRNFLNHEGAANARHGGPEPGKVHRLIFKENALDIGVQLFSMGGIQTPSRHMGHKDGQGFGIEMSERLQAEDGAQNAVIFAGSRIAHLRYEMDPGEQTTLDDDVVMIASAVPVADHDPRHCLRRQAAQVQIGRQDAAGHVVIGMATGRKRAGEMQVFRFVRQCREEPACGREGARRERAGDQIHAVAARISQRTRRRLVAFDMDPHQILVLSLHRSMSRSLIRVARARRSCLGRFDPLISKSANCRKVCMMSWDISIWVLHDAPSTQARTYFEVLAKPCFLASRWISCFLRADMVILSADFLSFGMKASPV
ncbi:hypothetical protein [Pelagivirga sediminicola]|nr:hypothetical protein [Pelagivirga sediminicola]